MINDDLPDLFDDGDPFDDPIWQSRPGKGYITCPLAWLARVLPVLRASDRLVVAMLLYRRCLVQRSKTVDLPNGELTKLGIGRDTKYRALRLLEEAGAITLEAPNGRSTRVMLHWFP